MRKRGFSLLELIVVIVIIGILGTLGFGQYTIVRERALGKEAVENLRLFADAQRVFRLEHGHYFGMGNLPPIPIDPSTAPAYTMADINQSLKLSLPTIDANWFYFPYGGGSGVAGGPPPSSCGIMAIRRSGITGCAYMLDIPNTTNDTPRVLGGWCP